MFTAERIALLLLAIAIVIWAAVGYHDNNKAPVILPERVVRIDSVANSDNTIIVGVTDKSDTGSRHAKERAKDKKRKSQKGKPSKSKDKAAKPPVKHRDHLRETVQE